MTNNFVMLLTPDVAMMIARVEKNTDKQTGKQIDMCKKIFVLLLWRFANLINLVVVEC